MPKHLNILYSTLEGPQIGVGGIKSVLDGLMPALARLDDISLSFVTPYFDVYDKSVNPDSPYEPSGIEQVATVRHIYNGRIHETIVYRAIYQRISDTKCIFHYLLRPVSNSPVRRIFDIQNAKDMYQSFDHSMPLFRSIYFRTAVASMIRTHNVNIPTFDIVHSHSWPADVSMLVKEFANLQNYQELLQLAPGQTVKTLRPIPWTTTTVHMLIKGEDGRLTSTDSVGNYIRSQGLPADFTQRFPDQSAYIQESEFRQMAPTLTYCDATFMVSEGVTRDSITGKGEGLDPLFLKLARENRLHGITNGITFADFDPRSEANLPGFTFNPEIRSISESKRMIKQRLAAEFTKLDPNVMWFMALKRLTKEKGAEHLIATAKAIGEVGGNFIVLCMHVAFVIKDGVKSSQYQYVVDELRAMPHVIVIDTLAEQKTVKKLFMGAVDVMTVVSLKDTCGLPPREAMPFAVSSIAADEQGLPDTVKCLSKNPVSGTGFLYNNDPETREENIKQAIFAIADFYGKRRADGTLETFLARLMQTAKQFDWSLAAEKFKALYGTIVRRPIVNFYDVRTVGPIPFKAVTHSTAMLSQFTTSTTTTAKGPVLLCGFNRCGTLSLHDFFWANKVKSIHYGYGRLTSTIYDNHENSRPLISEEYKIYSVFCDMENIYDPRGPIYGHRLFKEFAEQYPDSKFILNTRDKERWIASRCKHVDPANGRTYVEVLSERLNMSQDELIASWSKEWDEHHTAVIAYFNEKGRSADLLVFDIERDPIERVCTFFKDRLGIILDPSKYKHLHKTAEDSAHKRAKIDPRLSLV